MNFNGIVNKITASDADELTLHNFDVFISWRLNKAQEILQTNRPKLFSWGVKSSHQKLNKFIDDCKKFIKNLSEEPKHRQLCLLNDAYQLINTSRGLIEILNKLKLPELNVLFDEIKSHAREIDIACINQSSKHNKAITEAASMINVSKALTTNLFEDEYKKYNEYIQVINYFKNIVSEMYSGMGLSHSYERQIDFVRWMDAIIEATNKSLQEYKDFKPVVELEKIALNLFDVLAFNIDERRYDMMDNKIQFWSRFYNKETNFVKRYADYEIHWNSYLYEIYLANKEAYEKNKEIYFKRIAEEKQAHERNYEEYQRRKAIEEELEHEYMNGGSKKSKKRRTTRRRKTHKKH